MSTMTFRARDNATAFELVERRFGGDALILSTVYVDGLVEITATDEAPPPVNSAGVQRPKPGSRIDVNIDAPLSPEPVAPPAADTPASGLPRFLDRAAPRPFAEVLREANEATGSSAPAAPIPKLSPGPAPTPDKTAPRRDPALLRAELLAASRIVLVGPCGAGKTQVALQLALLRQAQHPHSPATFVFCGTGSKADGAVLAQKSHLLGMKTVYRTPTDLNAPRGHGTEILLISGRAEAAQDAARDLLTASGTKALLVLSDGLRSDRMKRFGTRWQEVTSSAVLGHVDPADIADVDLTPVAEAGLDALWISAADTLVDGLHPTPSGDGSASWPAPEAETANTPANSAAQVVFRRHKTKSEARP